VSETGRCDLWAAARGWSGIAADGGHSVGAVAALRPRSCRRLVVAVTHVGEDICAAGGLIARLADHDVPIDVLEVTDGDGATAGAAGATPPHELGRRRAHRSVSYQQLGAYDVRRHELALPSGRVAEAELDVVAALSEIVGFDPDPSGSWVLAPWQHDGHPDHDAVGRAAGLVCQAYRIRQLDYLVAAWGSTDLHRIPWPRARQLSLPPVLQLRKSSAVSAPGLDSGGFVPGDRETFLLPEKQMRPGRCGRPAGEWTGPPSAAELPQARTSMAAPGPRHRAAAATGGRRGTGRCRGLYR
jgi:GlcNAc-PI de-N-acetylase